MRKPDRELAESFESMVAGVGRLERRRAVERYLTGLLLDGERKSEEPMGDPPAQERQPEGSPAPASAAVRVRG